MGRGVKIVSWNINSVRFRIEIVERFLRDVRPDILCLQETKVVDQDFPRAAFKALGYDRIIVHGQRMHHGVAILSRLPLGDPGRHDWQDNGEARHVGARLECGIRLENVYVPAGGDIPDRALNPKFGQKLDFIERMTRWSDTLAEPTLIVGDFNVAPRACDVANPDVWADTVLCHPQARSALEELTTWGLHDVCAPHFANGGIYSWWDYRMLGFVKNDGLRIDLIYTTASLVPAVTEAGVDRNERKGKLPSDHAPVWVTLDMSACG